MEWKAANEQQQEALWRVFLMFVAMAVLIIRTGLVSRGALAAHPAGSAPQEAAPAANHQPSSTSPAELYQATLCVAVPGRSRRAAFHRESTRGLGVDEPTATLPPARAVLARWQPVQRPGAIPRHVLTSILDRDAFRLLARLIGVT